MCVFYVLSGSGSGSIYVYIYKAYPGTSQKSYWKIINRVMNKCRAPKIPPLLVNNVFILKKQDISMTIVHSSAMLSITMH